MVQTELWHDTIWDALGAAVQSAGGVKRVAKKLWPAMDDAQACTKLRACLNSDHAQKFDEDERLMLMGLAREAGDNSVMEFLARKLGYEIKTLSPQEAKKRARRARTLVLLEELRRLQGDEE